MELQIPYSVCAKRPKESILWRKAVGNVKDIKSTLRREDCEKDKREHKTLVRSKSSRRAINNEKLLNPFYG